nr:YidC/Oxa1 family membrane protein insertase [Nocardioides ungokensis]
MGIFGQIGHFIMTPLYYAISAVLVAWHWVFSLVLPADGGLSWVLSIIGLTLVIRAALIPLFVKQIKSSRNMQLIQPKVKELQKKYGHDGRSSPRRR